MPNKEKHIPKRRCIGCMESKPQSELIRIAYGSGASIDLLGKEPGRGMYICKSKECLGKAVKRNSFQRASKGSIRDAAAIVAELEGMIESDQCR